MGHRGHVLQRKSGRCTAMWWEKDSGRPVAAAGCRVHTQWAKTSETSVETVCFMLHFNYQRLLESSAPREEYISKMQQMSSSSLGPPGKIETSVVQTPRPRQSFAFINKTFWESWILLLHQKKKLLQLLCCLRKNVSNGLEFFLSTDTSNWVCFSFACNDDGHLKTLEFAGWLVLVAPKIQFINILREINEITWKWLDVYY